MQCDAQHSIKLDKPKPDGRGGLIYNVPINCGKCYPCKKNRCNQWSFRLMKEQEVSTSSKFVTLTYDTEHVPISKNGFMTLRKKEGEYSLQAFFKRLRYYEGQRQTLSSDQINNIVHDGVINISSNIKYYAVGEYGSKRKRPHFHIILFNVLDEKSIFRAWKFGGIDIQEVNNNTIDYTLKYMMKEPQKRRFKAYDAEKEFSLMSKGIGENWLKKKM